MEGKCGERYHLDADGVKVRGLVGMQSNNGWSSKWQRAFCGGSV